MIIRSIALLSLIALSLVEVAKFLGNAPAAGAQYLRHEAQPSEDVSWRSRDGW